MTSLYFYVFELKTKDKAEGKLDNEMTQNKKFNFDIQLNILFVHNSQN